MTAASQVKVGYRHGRWTVTDATFERLPSGAALFWCRCGCGTERNVLFKGQLNSWSCGCLQRETATEQGYRHGGTQTKLYRIWIGIKARCENPSDTGYHWYGGRGIRVCARWSRSFPAFRDWAFDNGYGEDLQLDRTNNEGDYKPSNCRWIPEKENHRNTRWNHWIKAWGEKKVMVAWSEDPRCKVGLKTLERRINKLGWSPEEAMTRPKYFRPTVVED